MSEAVMHEARKLTLDWLAQNADDLGFVDRHGLAGAIERFERVGLYSLTLRHEQKVMYGEITTVTLEDAWSFERPKSVPLLYRGAVPGTEGIGWTTDFVEAIYYALMRRGAVYQCQFSPESVLAHLQINCPPSEQFNDWRESIGAARSASGSEWIMRPNGEARIVSAVPQNKVAA